MDDERPGPRVLCSLGELVESLFEELSCFPIPPMAKNFLVIAMVADLARRDGRSVYFQLSPYHQISRKVA